MRDQIAAEIAQNKWAPGAAIASESELATTYNLSIGTVRRAVDCLVNDGLLKRVHGSGTFVGRPDYSHAYIRFRQVYGSARDTRVTDSRILLREITAGPSAVTDALKLEPGARVIRMLRLYIHNNVPVMHEEIWLDAVQFAPIMTMADCTR